MLWNNERVNKEIKGQLKKKKPLSQMKTKRKHTEVCKIQQKQF